MKRLNCVIFATICYVMCFSTASQAQSTEERFHDLFVTAGYSTAFGAALGTAVLGLSNEPASNLRFVAIGASLGFIGGSAMGAYIVFSPMVDAERQDETTLLASNPIPDKGFMIRPTYGTKSKKITAIEGGMTLFSF